MAVWLAAENEMRIIAPLRLDDLFEMRLRRNPRQITRERFATRLKEKDPSSRWPLVKVVQE